MMTQLQKKLLGQLYTASKAGQIQDIEDQILMTLNEIEDEDELFKQRLYLFKYMQRVLDRATRAPRTHFEGLINSWSKYDHESWSAVWIVEGNDPEEVLERMHSMGFNTEGYYAGYAGGSYCNPAYASRAAQNRILVTQRGGLDV